MDLHLPGVLVGLISEAEKKIAGLNRGDAEHLRPVARLLLRTESVASSKVEGMQVNARQLARAEASPGLRRGREVADVVANIAAMEYAIDSVSHAGAITPEDLAAVHRVLMSNDPSTRAPGRIRVVQNWIGGNDYNPCGADFVPPPPEEVPVLLDDLCAYANGQESSPLVQAAIAHAQFETIHPFEDGNGRTGRALVQVILRRRGLAPHFLPPISVVLAQDRARYIEGLARFRDDDGVPRWIETFAEASAAAAHLAERYASKVSELREGWRSRLRRGPNPRADAAAWLIIDLLPAHPVVTATLAAKMLGRSHQAVTAGIAQLVSCGVLAPLTGSARNREWEAEELTELIVAFDSGAL